MTTSQLFTGIVALTLATGCTRSETSQQAREAAADVRSAAARAGDTLADSWLTAKVQAQFFADNDIKSRYIDVDTRDGVVSLQGFVESDQVRQEALQIARNTDGVRDVDDKLLIGQAPQDAQASPDAGAAIATTGSALPAPTGADAEAMDDTMITSLIQAKYFRDPQIKSRNIDVAAVNGVVTLRGQVASDDERAKALLLARTTGGVERVEDSLTIDASLGQAPPPLRGSTLPGATQAAPAGATPQGTSGAGAVGTSGVRAEDAALEGALRTRLAADATLKSAGLEVSARDGVVLLQGMVPDPAAKLRALTLAGETEGVVQVVDRLRVTK